MDYRNYLRQMSETRTGAVERVIGAQAADTLPEARYALRARPRNCAARGWERVPPGRYPPEGAIGPVKLTSSARGISRA